MVFCAHFFHRRTHYPTAFGVSHSIFFPCHGPHRDSCLHGNGRAETGYASVIFIPFDIYAGAHTYVHPNGRNHIPIKLATNTIDVIDKWLGRLPGRLSLLAAAGGTIFSALSGSSIANTAMLGTALLPEMKERGYKTSMPWGQLLVWVDWRCLSHRRH